MRRVIHEGSRRAGLLGVMLVVGAWGVGCVQAPAPVLMPLRKATDRVPVIFVPGVTGVALRDRETGRLVWGKGGNLIRPHDRGYGTAKSIVDDRHTAAIAADQVILGISIFGLVRKPIYRPLVDLFEANGYRWGDLGDPAPDDSFFLFAYDWRLDNVTSAQLLARRLERLRQVRGAETLEVVLVCQSNGAHVCRYFAKYGAATLEEAEQGDLRRPIGVELQKIVLVGASNGGSLRVLRELNRGRKYVRGVGRVWSPETLFTFRSLFQDLPAHAADLFVDERGEEIPVDLFDPASWRKFGWGIHGTRARRRLAGNAPSNIFGDDADREAYLRETLHRAKRFHRLLKRDVSDLGPIRYFLVQNSHNPTPRRALLLRRENTWVTLFSGDRRLERWPGLKPALTSPGDGHATLESQRWLSPQEVDRISWDSIDVPGEHFEMILDAVTQTHLLEIVADDGRL